MFEDSLFASRQHTVSARNRWTAVASIATQGLIASLLIILPLLHTESLSKQRRTLTLTPPLQVEPPKTVVQHVSTGVAAAVPLLGRIFTAPRTIPRGVDTTPAPDTSTSSFTSMSTGTPMGTLLGVTDTRAKMVVTVAPEKKVGPVRVSSGISAGLLLTPIRPVYPPIAKAARVEGAVVVEAIISKTGTIESLHAVSGPQMLQTAALDAIRAARYQPFKLNGEPTEVQTTITVNFHLGS